MAGPQAAPRPARQRSERASPLPTQGQLKKATPAPRTCHLGYPLLGAAQPVPDPQLHQDPWRLPPTRKRCDPSAVLGSLPNERAGGHPCCCVLSEQSLPLVWGLSSTPSTPSCLGP